jgi:hypothetical protein
MIEPYHKSDMYTLYNGDVLSPKKANDDALIETYI